MPAPLDPAIPPPGAAGIVILGSGRSGRDGLLSWVEDGLMLWAPEVLAEPCWLAPGSIRLARVAALGEWGREATAGGMCLSRHPAGANAVMVLTHDVQLHLRTVRNGPSQWQTTNSVHFRVQDPGALGRELTAVDVDVDWYEHA